MDFFQSYDREKGYNVCPVASSTLGFHHSAESKMKMSSKLKGRKSWAKGLTKETNSSIAEGGKKTSVTRKQLYQKGKLNKLIGDKNPMFGRKGEKCVHSKVSDEQRREIYRLYNEGNILQREIGELFHLSQGQIGKIILSFQENRKKMEKFSPSSEDKKNIITFFSNGLSCKALSIQYQCNISTIHRIVKNERKQI